MAPDKVAEATRWASGTPRRGPRPGRRRRRREAERDHGTRHTESGYPIPLAPVMAPLSYASPLGEGPWTGFVTGLAPSLLMSLGAAGARPRRRADGRRTRCSRSEYEGGFVALGARAILLVTLARLCYTSSGPPRRVSARPARLSQNAPPREVLGRVAVVRLVRPRRVLEAPKPKLDVVVVWFRRARIAYRMKCTKIARACTDVV